MTERFSPTESGAYALQLEQIKEKEGCAKCKHRDEHRGWDFWSCVHGNTVNRAGFCKYWRYLE